MNQDLFKKLLQDAPQRFAIFGFGVTGKAVAQFLVNRGHQYFVFDQGETPQTLPEGCLGWRSSKDDVSDAELKEFKVFFPSPGILPTDPLMRRIHALSLPTLGELEMASFYLERDFIAVTGTNGKSTTVMLIGFLLERASVSSGVFGNIGTPLIEAVGQDLRDVYVLEESSYQLEQIQTLRHRISICLNLSEDHLARYKTMDAYRKAKERIFSNSQPDDFFIFNADNSHCVKMAQSASCVVLPYSLVNHFEMGAFVDKNEMVVRLFKKEWRFDLADCSLEGLHNQENMLASLLAALLVDHSDVAVSHYRKALKEFKGLPHRMQNVRVLNGVRYINDSKATNVDAVVMALASFEKDVILLAGGEDKGSSYQPLKSLIEAKVKTLILFGTARFKMAEELKNLATTEIVETLSEAVKLAQKHSSSGDVVLLSPACASFDQFKNFAHRGDVFSQIVEGLV